MKFFKIFFSIILFSFGLLANAQKKDTIFYDSYWNKSTKEQAKFYRPLPLKKQGELYVVKDYFIDGKLQMKAFSLSNTKDDFQGKAIWYYPNGKKNVERNYSNNKFNGEEKSYFRDGKLLSKGTYKNNQRQNGTFYVANNRFIKTITIKDSFTISRNAYYQDTKTFAQRTFLESGSFSKAEYYDKKGNIIIKKQKYADNPREVVFALNEHKNVEKILFIKYETKKNGQLLEVLKDVKGNIIAEGVFNNGKYSGKFFDYNKLESYKDGALNGETIFYDANFKEVCKGIYKNDQKYSGGFLISDDKVEIYENAKLIKVKTKNRFTKEHYECEYKNEKPYSGKEFFYSDLNIYKDGKLTEKIDFDYSTGKKQSQTFYDTSSNRGYDEASKKLFFKNGKTYTLNYKNGSADNGVEVTHYGYVTLNEGNYDGPYLIEDKNFKETGSYKNFKKHGEVIIINRKDTLKITYDKGKPINGAFFDQKSYINYKNGEKIGCGYALFNSRRIPYDSVTKCYDKGLIANKKYYYKKVPIGEGIYKNGKPFTGDFYDSGDVKKFKNGVILYSKTKKGYNYYEKEQFYEAGIPVKEIFKNLKTDSTYTSIFKNGKPFNGKSLALDSVNKYKINLLVTDYKNGEKNGYENHYNSSLDKLQKRITYVNNKKEGKAIFILEKVNDTLVGYYKDDLPFNGSFINFYQNNTTKNTYKNGKIEEVETYRSYQQTKVTEVDYKNNVPYNGMLIQELEDKRRLGLYYKNGKLTKTYVDPYGFSAVNLPQATATVTHLKNLDSIKYAYSAFANMIIEYSNKKRTSGKVSFFQHKKLKGTASFKKNMLKQLNFEWSDKEDEKFAIKLQDKQVVNTISLPDFIAEARNKNIEITTEPYLYFIKLIKGFKPEGEVSIKMPSENIESKILFKDKRPYQGIIFEYKPFQNVYRLSKYENGKETEEYFNLTKQEFLEKFNQLKTQE